MNRTDRLYALVEDLRTRAPRFVGARALAERFEVSVRTIERDLLSLQEAGVPIWTQPGPGGGYTLDARTTLPPLNLTAAEATAIATALAAGGTLPFVAAGHSALRKLAAVMSTTDRDAAGALVGCVRLAGAASPPPPPSVAAVEEAVVAGVAEEIEYEDKEGRRTTRTVEPAGLLRGRQGWYLVGWCRLRDGARVFRLDRIRHARPTAERVAPRPIDDLIEDIPHPFRQPSLLA